jgi:hypothetical protein
MNKGPFHLYSSPERAMFIPKGGIDGAFCLRHSCAHIIKRKFDATSIAWSNSWQKPSRKKGLHDVLRLEFQ